MPVLYLGNFSEGGALSRFVASGALVLVLLAVCTSAVAATGDTAAKRAPKLPPAPIRCQNPTGSGCYGWVYGPEFMDNTFIGDLTVSPHIVRVGQSINVKMEVISNPDWGTPKAYEPCHKARCTVKMTSPTSSWMRFPARFCFDPPIACAVEQDALYVLDGDEYAVSGMVRGFDGKGAGPGLRVNIAPGYFAVTEMGGFYQALLPKGTYTVSGPEGYCVGTVSRKGCQSSQKVVLSDARGTAAVDFREQTHLVSGRVTESDCRKPSCVRAPVAGVTVTATSGPKSTKAVTGSNGKYSLQVGHGPVAIKPGPGDDFEPAERLLIVRDDTRGVDFNRCAEDEESGAPAGESKGCGSVLITGKVRDVAGGPANLFCLVFVGGRGRSYDAVTNSDGVYAVEVPRGTYTVQSNYHLTDVPACRNQSILEPLRTKVKATKPQVVLNLRTTPTVDATVVNFTRPSGYDRLFIVVHSPPPGSWHLNFFFAPRGNGCRRDMFDVNAEANTSWVEFEIRSDLGLPGFCAGSYTLMVSRPSSAQVILNCTLIAFPNDPWDTQPWYGSHPTDKCPVRSGFGTPRG